MNSIANSAVRHLPEGTALDAEFAAAQQAYVDKWKWFLPLKDYAPLHPEDQRVAAYHFDWLRHPEDDAYWQAWSIRRRWAQVTVPAINFEGWYDLFVNGAIENFVGMRKNGGSQIARDGQRLVIGPWVHLGWQQKVGDIDFGPEAVSPMPELHEALVRLLAEGRQERRRHRTACPCLRHGREQVAHVERLADRGHRVSAVLPAQQRCGKHGLRRRHAGDEKADAEGPADKYKYDPKDPVPSIGGRFQQVVPPGPRDQRPLLARSDVLVYTTAPLENDVEVTGPITVTLYAASSATDTDFTAKLDDVYPDGTSMLISYGIQRARYRESQARQALIKPGQTYKYTIQVWPTSNLFKAGHRIRVEISSSNFPMFDRNPNTGHPFGQDSELQIADQTIFHDKDRPSMITLPIVAAPLR